MPVGKAQLISAQQELTTFLVHLDYWFALFVWFILFLQTL